MLEFDVCQLTKTAHLIGSEAIKTSGKHEYIKNERTAFWKEDFLFLLWQTGGISEDLWTYPGFCCPLKLLKSIHLKTFLAFSFSRKWWLMHMGKSRKMCRMHRKWEGIKMKFFCDFVIQKYLNLKKQLKKNRCETSLTKILKTLHALKKKILKCGWK